MKTTNISQLYITMLIFTTLCVLVHGTGTYNATKQLVI